MIENIIEDIIENIIGYLLTNTDITNKVGDRISLGIPDATPKDIYITFNILSENITTVEKRNRVSIKIFGKEGSSYSELKEIEKEVFNSLRYYREDGVYKIINANYFNGYSSENNKMLLRDILIYYTY